MKTTNTEKLQSLAIVRATALCDAALATLATGRKTFVKGKPVMVPWGDEKRMQLKALQIDAFKPGYQVDGIVADAVDFAVEGATDEASAQAILADAVAVYCAAGRAEVERRFEGV